MPLLLYAAFFAFVFENLSIVLFAGQVGGYHYHEGFNLFFYKTPVFIILLWSAIIYSAHEIVGRFAAPRSVIFIAPLYILALDLVLDQVAVSLGLWTWYGLGEQTGLYSVPAANYIGWLLLPLLFYWSFHALKNTKYLIFQPLLTYLAFIIFSIPLHLLKINFFDGIFLVEYLVFFLIVLVVITTAYFNFQKNTLPTPKNPALFAVRLFLHFFSLTGLLYLGVGDHLYLLLALLLIIVMEALVFYGYQKQRV
jgi:hypothetical protein